MRNGIPHWYFYYDVAPSLFETIGSLYMIKNLDKDVTFLVPLDIVSARGCSQKEVVWLDLACETSGRADSKY
jgi:hypothetical protein